MKEIEKNMNRMLLLELPNKPPEERLKEIIDEIDSMDGCMLIPRNRMLARSLLDEAQHIVESNQIRANFSFGEGLLALVHSGDDFYNLPEGYPPVEVKYIEKRIGEDKIKFEIYIDCGKSNVKRN